MRVYSAESDLEAAGDSPLCGDEPDSATTSPDQTNWQITACRLFRCSRPASLGRWLTRCRRQWRCRRRHQRIRDKHFLHGFRNFIRLREQFANLP